MASRDHGGVVFVLEGRASEVNEADVGSFQDFLRFRLLCRRVGGSFLRFYALEKDVFGFEVGVDQLHFVQDCE